MSWPREGLSTVMKQHSDFFYASFLLYEDDGISFHYLLGDWMGIAIKWNDARRALELKLAPGSRMLSPSPRIIDVQLLGQKKSTIFQGEPVSLSFPK